MLICTISVVANVIILIFHHRNIKIYKMPPWIKKWICGYLAKVLFMKNPQAQENSGSSLNLSNGLELTKIDYRESSSKSLLANVYDDKIKDFVLNDDFGIIGNGRLPLSTASLNRQKHNAIYRQQGKINELQTSSSETSILQQELQNILKEIRCMTKKISDDEADEGEELDWKFAAMVLDKLCLYLFGSLTVVTTLVLMRTPNFFKFY